MTREGYAPEFAAATTAAGGLLSPIIPPSMLFIIYGVMAQIAIGDLFDKNPAILGALVSALVPNSRDDLLGRITTMTHK